MQAFKNLFSRAQAQTTAVPSSEQGAQPVELSAESLKLVAGGLPRIGGLGSGATAPDTTGTAAATLPSVS
jgi:hypothetical protein